MTLVNSSGFVLPLGEWQRRPLFDHSASLCAVGSTWAKRAQRACSTALICERPVRGFNLCNSALLRSGEQYWRLQKYLQFRLQGAEVLLNRGRRPRSRG